MLKIRLKRTGRRNNPAFRVIVTEVGRAAKTGNVIDNLGFYNPKLKEKQIDKEKAEKWLSDGAKPSDTVHNLLVDMGLIKADKINVLPRKSPIVKEAEEGQEAEPKGEAEAEEGAVKDAADDVKEEEGSAEEAKEPEAPSAEEESAPKSDSQSENKEESGETEDSADEPPAAPTPPKGESESRPEDVGKEAATGEEKEE